MAACWSSSFTAELAAARIGATYNQYADSELRRERLRAYLDAHSAASTIRSASRKIRWSSASSTRIRW